jgi:mRNA-degrading endonuclease toxin of MazEF toxin-antitoxin module
MMAIQRGEVYFVNLNPVKGREQAGQRPVLVLSNDAINQLPLVVTVVIGTKGSNVTKDYPTNVRVPPQESCVRQPRTERASPPFFPSIAAFFVCRPFGFSSEWW